MPLEWVRAPQMKKRSCKMRDPIEVAVMALMAVLAWAGAYVPALILFGVLVATVVDRAVTK